jgi:hypothetical protein
LARFAGPSNQIVNGVTNPANVPKKAAATGHFGMVRGWVLLGFWRFVVGE